MAARRASAARLSQLLVLQRWLSENHHRLLTSRLFHAARRGDEQEVEDVLARRPELLYVRADEPGWRPTLLHAVAESGQLELLQRLSMELAHRLLGRPV